MTNRTIKESPLSQGEDEIIVYELTTTPWGSSPVAQSVVVFDITDPGAWEDVTATVMPVNSPSVAGDVITLSPLRDLTDGHRYRLEIRFSSGGNTFETHCLIYGGE